MHRTILLLCEADWGSLLDKIKSLVVSKVIVLPQSKKYYANGIMLVNSNDHPYKSSAFLTIFLQNIRHGMGAQPY
jgi:hypothetical protein